MHGTENKNMDSMMQRLLDNGFGEMIDFTREEFLKKDETYQAQTIETNKSEEEFMRLKLLDEEKRVIENYIAHIQREASRYADISYFAGMKDAIRMMVDMGFIQV